ncbi:nicotinamide-nucleotide amidohydrolase family protein [Microbacterium esteraromaticum]|uniref:CinA family protein n=1 Tax=Microbacterium esteraromaticum TaxID=57043 RepID=UPI001A8FD2EE|nr:nicotinamide-nucleotide amidohydrolase family protein [Microbacterium esteraromaticum]MBN8423616.1 nicotinamide-nucleotide amidohydrolase family protein [Microbacterium esteraromaticum]
MTVAAELLTLLAERGWRLGVAESLTGGAVSAELVTVPGASAVLNGAVVAYATPVKQTLLGVDAKLLEQHGPVHPEVAEQMADGVRRAVAVDGRATEVGVSTTGIAGPDSPDGQPVGTVHVGVVTPVVRLVRSFVFAGDRSQIRAQARDAALAAALEAVRE